MKAGWKTEPLGSLCDILDSQRKPITKRDRLPGEYPYYGATGILDFVEGYLFDEPLVLVGEDGAKWGSGENTAFVVTGKCWVNNHAHVLKPNRTKLLDNWLMLRRLVVPVIYNPQFLTQKDAPIDISVLRAAHRALLRQQSGSTDAFLFVLCGELKLEEATTAIAAYGKVGVVSQPRSK